MAIQSQPSRIPEPFAGSGSKNTIPATNTSPSASQAASWASGFPLECSLPIASGGCPVPRNDVNGALNWLSQDFAFRQDGGIWTWSSLADYPAGRIVLGSNGKLYWSVAQSGPNVGGAKNPTTDTAHAYWNQLSTSDISDLVHITGTETITGAKTFSQTITGSISGKSGSSDKTYEIAAWTSGTDYTAYQLARNSSGTVYMAMQASGPSTGAGAKNPNTDDGTYWSAVGSPTVSALDSSNSVANTAWVRNAVGDKSIYVDRANGNDSNDGLSGSTAVKTIGQGIVLARGHVLGAGASHTLYIAGGTYSEDIALNGDRFNIVLSGAVTLSGSFSINYGSRVRISGGNALTINSSSGTALQVARGSMLFSSENITAKTASGSVCYVAEGSSARFDGTLTLTSNGASYGINVRYGSSISLAGDVTIGGSGVSMAVSVLGTSVMSIGANLTVDDIVSGAGLQVSSESCVLISSGTVQIYSGASATFACGVLYNSLLYVSDPATVRFYYRGVSSGNVLEVSSNSVAYHASSSTFLFSALSSCDSLIYVSRDSSMTITTQLNLSNASGTTVSVGAVYVALNSVLDISAGATINGTQTGSRYSAAYGGQIIVHGAGANRIPGASAGTANATSFGYYG